MNVINVTPEMNVLKLGRLGENERTQFVFDVSDWLEEYPGATIGLSNRLPRSNGSYPCAVTSEGDGKYSWTVTGTELAREGDGECELVAVKGNTVMRGKVYKTQIGHALDGAEDPPEPWSGVVAEVTRMAGDAEAYAIGQRNGADVGREDPTYHNNAKYYRDQIVEALEEVVPQYGELTFPVTRGTKCFHNNLLYKANQDISTSEEWTAAHWEEVNIEGEQLLIHVMKFDGVESGDVLNYGESIVIKGDAVGIIDFGLNADCTELLEYFGEAGITKIDWAVITHYHSDHITTSFSSAMDALIAGGIDFTDCIFYLPHKGIDWSQVAGSSGSTETAVKNKLTALEIEYTEPDDGDVVRISDNLTLKFNNIGSSYYSQYYDYKLDSGNNTTENTTYNNFSMIVTLKHYNNLALFTGDIHQPAQKANAANVERCDLYKIEHHAINYSADDIWLDTIKPKYAAIAVYSSNYEDDKVRALARQTVNTISKLGGCVSANSGGALEYISNKTGLYLKQGTPFEAVPASAGWDLIAGVELIKENFPSANLDQNGLIDIDTLTTPGIYYSMNKSRATANMADKTILGAPTLLNMGAPRIQVVQATNNYGSCMQIIDFPYNSLYRLIRTMDSGTWSAFRVFATNTIFENVSTLQAILDIASAVPQYRPFMCGIENTLASSMFGINASGIFIGKKLSNRIDYTAVLGGTTTLNGRIDTSNNTITKNKLENEIAYEEYTFDSISYSSGGTVGERLDTLMADLTNQTYTYISATVTYNNGSAKMIAIPVIRDGSGVETKQLALLLYRATTEAISNATVKVRTVAKVPVAT